VTKFGFDDFFANELIVFNAAFCGKNKKVTASQDDSGNNQDHSRRNLKPRPSREMG
jgi:hypothetical protein